MKKTLTAFLLTITVCLAHAQTKVFKEVGKDISSEVKAIIQDNSLVGYLVFTRLEKANADSFNYKIAIMDENLNDIGTVKFRDMALDLQSVSFEQDILCLAYLKSNVINEPAKNRKKYKQAVLDQKTSVFVQFVSLDGKIVKSNTFEATLTPQTNSYGIYTGEKMLKHSLQLTNIPQKGFALFFGDDRKSNLVTFSANGDILWQKNTTEQAQRFNLLAAKQAIYLLVKRNHEMKEGGYELLSYAIADGAVFPKYELKDKQGHSLKVFTFDIDPTSGLPFMAGNIIDLRKGNNYITAKKLARGPYAGVFTININGTKKADIKESFSYWNDGSQSFISSKGHLASNNTYPRLERAFKDFQGNTIFVGSTVIRRAKFGSIFFTVATAPTVIIPLFIAGGGYTKARLAEAVLIKQTEKGAISVDNTIATNRTKPFPGAAPINMYDNRYFYFVTNHDTKSNYVIINDAKDIFVYNASKKNIVRTIPHKDGNVRTNVFPAKEGHMMIATYNGSETRVSIEAL
ncbi:DUF6770 family protein [Longitalea luteola]|uniref:DUF6770 family protein n=1 Tax=Longitalea luteola TaxID=2812563 RepID=UPI001A95C3F4|nr:DUF6770 family protein [Longitalea luteola]